MISPRVPPRDSVGSVVREGLQATPGPCGRLTFPRGLCPDPLSLLCPQDTLRLVVLAWAPLGQTGCEYKLSPGGGCSLLP